MRNQMQKLLALKKKQIFLVCFQTYANKFIACVVTTTEAATAAAIKHKKKEKQEKWNSEKDSKRT